MILLLLVCRLSFQTLLLISCCIIIVVYLLFAFPSNFAVKEILKLCPDRVLVTLYKVPSFDSVDDFLQKVATVRGKLKKGGVLDIGATARIILHDWNEGMHLFFQLVHKYLNSYMHHSKK